MQTICSLAVSRSASALSRVSATSRCCMHVRYVANASLACTLLHDTHTSIHTHDTINCIFMCQKGSLICHMEPKKQKTEKVMKQRQQQQPFYGPLSRTTRVRWYQKKHSPTHHPDHHPIFISFFHLPRTIFHSKILPVQITCLAIYLHKLFPCPLWSTSWSGALHLIFHTFLHPISVLFLQHMPIPSQPVLL